MVRAGGYSGAELLGILLGHPSVDVVGLYGSASRGAGSVPRDDRRDFSKVPRPVRAAGGCRGCGSDRGMRADVAFLATPHEASLELAPQLIKAGMVVLDLSAAFRLKDGALYPKHYGFEHHARELLRSPYGLPELFRAKLREAALIAVPGCYPTSAILPLARLLQGGGDRAGTAAGDRFDERRERGGALAEREEFVLRGEPASYNVFEHRHQPEIDAYTRCVDGVHAAPSRCDRGILSTIHVDLIKGCTDIAAGCVPRGVWE